MGGEVSLCTLSSTSATEPRTIPMPSARCPAPRDRLSAVSAVRLIYDSILIVCIYQRLLSVEYQDVCQSLTDCTSETTTSL